MDQFDSNHTRDSRWSRKSRGLVLRAALLAGLGAAAFGIWQWRSTPGSAQLRSEAPLSSKSGELLVTAYRTASCGCCKGWLNHLEAAGFNVKDHVVDDLSAVKRTHRVPAELSSCHTATVGGYVIEGHTPATAIRKLLRQRPAVAGLAVPGMPLGSPGMESHLRSEAYTVFSFTANGVVRPFEQIEA